MTTPAATGPTYYVRDGGLHRKGGTCDCKVPCTEVVKVEDVANILAQNAAMRAAIDSALEYFEDREDVVDGSYGEPAPNKEMALAQELRTAIGVSP